MNHPTHHNYRKRISAQWKSARAWIASERLRKIRAILFQVYVLVAVLIFAGLALLANNFPVFQPDVQITLNLQEDTPRWVGLVLEAVSVPGYAVESIIVIVVVTIALWAIGLHWEAASALFAGVSEGLVNFLVKSVVHRPRPAANLVDVFQNVSGFSFPSGHVMFYTTFFGFLLFLTFILLKRTWWRYITMILLGLLIALVGVSRMYLGEHWASDVIGGYALGSLTLILSIMFYRWGKERRVVQQPIAATGGGEGPVPADEKKEVKEALNNPLLPKTEEIKEASKEVNDNHPDRP